MKPILCALVLSLALSTPPREKEISGKVVDADGKPVAGCDIGTYWSATAEGGKPYKALQSGEDGTFTGKINYYGRPVALMAQDKDRKRGGVVILNKENVDAEITLKLGPLVDVKATFDSKGLGKKPEWTNTMLFVLPDRARLISCSSREALCSIRVPAGKYRFWAYGTDVRNYTKNIEVGGKGLDLGDIDLQPTVLALHYGKAPPEWNVTAARGVKAEVKLDDYKGRWVLLEFWGFW